MQDFNTISVTIKGKLDSINNNNNYNDNNILYANNGNTQFNPVIVDKMAYSISVNFLNTKDCTLDLQ